MSQLDLERFDFLREAAEEMGALQARVIPADLIVVEHHVTLKCRSGCRSYGNKLTCPPHVPTPKEFAKILKGYSAALIVKFPSPAQADDELILSISRSWLDPDSPEETTEETTRFWSEYFTDATLILDLMLDLERLAIDRGHTFALALVNASCRLCETCNIKNGVCLNPTRARIPEHAVGINIKRTAEKAGMPIRFPISGRAEPMALLLIE
jgi:predicted metal-binding protein